MREGYFSNKEQQRQMFGGGKRRAYLVRSPVRPDVSYVPRAYKKKTPERQIEARAWMPVKGI